MACRGVSCCGRRAFIRPLAWRNLLPDAVALSDLRDKARQMWAQLQWACSSRPCVVRAGAPSASDSEPQDASRLHSACRARVLGEP